MSAKKATAIALATSPVLDSQQRYTRAAFRNPRNESLILVKIWALERSGMIPEVGRRVRQQLASGFVEVFAKSNDDELDLMIDGARGENDDGANLFAERLNEKVGGGFLDIILQLLPLLLPLITCL